MAEVESLKENQSDAAIHDAHHLAYLSTHYLQLVMSFVLFSFLDLTHNVWCEFL